MVTVRHGVCSAASPENAAKFPSGAHGGSTLIAQPVQCSRAPPPATRKNTFPLRIAGTARSTAASSPAARSKPPLTKTLSHSVGCFQSAGTVPRTDRVHPVLGPPRSKQQQQHAQKAVSIKWRRPSVKGEQPAQSTPQQCRRQTGKKQRISGLPVRGRCNPSGHLCPARADRAADGNAPAKTDRDRIAAAKGSAAQRHPGPPAPELPRCTLPAGRNSATS